MRETHAQAYICSILSQNEKLLSNDKYKFTANEKKRIRYF